jgi:hypothetical protein
MRGDWKTNWALRLLALAMAAAIYLFVKARTS